MSDNPSTRYQDNLANFRRYYDLDADRRDNAGIDPWKVEERAHFLSLLIAEEKKSLLEVGAGPGRDSHYFAQYGLQVTATDLSAEMVEKCRQKGLKAYQMDFYRLDFAPGSFDAIYALNCLLHVPKADLQGVLRQIRRLMSPDGLFYIGMYGGKDEEKERDGFQPLSRFFATYSDEGLQQVVGSVFELVEFRSIPLTDETGRFQFQSTIWQKGRDPENN